MFCSPTNTFLQYLYTPVNNIVVDTTWFCFTPSFTALYDTAHRPHTRSEAVLFKHTPLASPHPENTRRYTTDVGAEYLSVYVKYT